MSEELEWELFDIFESGLFAFPLYEHQTARRIIRYLMFRGVLAEEIADAIEDSTTDLYIWLNRSGKNMVGEWVIAWVNDSREDYKREKKREAREAGYDWVDHEGGDSLDSDSSGGDGFSDGDGPPQDMVPLRTSSRKESVTKRISHIRPTSDSFGESSDEDGNDTDSKGTEGTPPPLPPRTPHTQPVRVQIETNHITQSILRKSDSVETNESDLSPRSPGFYEHTPDSGAVSDIYSSIPPSHARENLNGPDNDDRTIIDFEETIVEQSLVRLERASLANSMMRQENLSRSLIGLQHDELLKSLLHLQREEERSEVERENRNNAELSDLMNDTHTSIDVTDFAYDLNLCTSESHINVLNSGLPTCPNCHCKISYYHLINERRLKNMAASQTTENKDNKDANSDKQCNPITKELSKEPQPTENGTIPQGSGDDDQQHYMNELIRSEGTVSKAMELHLDTLLMEGPGYIFIMTDSANHFSPWSEACRYKIASSRAPERWLVEFRSRNLQVDLIWQVKVRHHVRALREVHAQLEQFNEQTNWFRCSLSTIMETISHVVRKYKP